MTLKRIVLAHASGAWDRFEPYYNVLSRWHQMYTLTEKILHPQYGIDDPFTYIKERDAFIIDSALLASDNQNVAFAFQLITNSVSSEKPTFVINRSGETWLLGSRLTIPSKHIYPMGTAPELFLNSIGKKIRSYH